MYLYSGVGKLRVKIERRMEIALRLLGKGGEEDGLMILLAIMRNEGCKVRKVGVKGEGKGFCIYLCMYIKVLQ